MAKRKKSVILMNLMSLVFLSHLLLYEGFMMMLAEKPSFKKIHFFLLLLCHCIFVAFDASLFLLACVTLSLPLILLLSWMLFMLFAYDEKILRPRV